MYHTEQKAHLIQGVINHSGPATSIFISFPIYHTQRFNNFANLLLLIQVSRDKEQDIIHKIKLCLGV